MAVPLGLSLQHIAQEAVTANQIRSTLAEASGPNTRVTQLYIDFQASPIAVRAVIIAPRQKVVSTAQLAAAIKARIGQTVALKADQVLSASTNGLDDAKTALARAQELQIQELQAANLRAMLALAAGVAPDQVLIDSGAHLAQVAAIDLPGANLTTYRALEARVAALADGWTITIVPPAGLELLPIPITSDGQLSAEAANAAQTDIWAARRWNWSTLGIPGWSASPPPRPTPQQIEAIAIAQAAVQAGLTPVDGGSSKANHLFLTTMPTGASPHARH